MPLEVHSPTTFRFTPLQPVPNGPCGESHVTHATAKNAKMNMLMMPMTATTRRRHVAVLH